MDEPVLGWIFRSLCAPLRDGNLEGLEDSVNVSAPLPDLNPNLDLGLNLRACFRIALGPAARDFGCGQGGEAGASPKRAVTGEPTRATAKRTAARRVFAEKAAWLRCSSVTDPSWVCSLVAPRHSAFSAKTGPHGILKQALILRQKSLWKNQRS